MRRALTLACLLLSLFAAPAARGLPDGRVYEQVTPADKNGGDVGGPAFEGEFSSAFGQSSADGNAIGYVSLSSFAGAPSAEFLTNYISVRGDTGWTTRAVSPPAAVPARFIEPSPFRAFSADLSTALLERAGPALAAGAAPGFDNLYLRRADGGYGLVSAVAPPSRTPGEYTVRFAGATADLGHLVFEANDALVPQAPPGARSVYEWSGSGPLRLVSVLPDGSASPSARAGDGQLDDLADVISADGSRIYWTDGEKQLYVREGGVRTVKVNTSHRTGGASGGTATLLAITPDGSRAIFTDPIALTDDPGDQGGGIYEYDLATGSLRDLTPHSGSPDIQGVLGMSADGSTVYFVASAVLASGAKGAAANLYVARNGEVDLIAVLSGGDSANWDVNPELRSSRVTPDGAHLAFISRASPTGYDNADAVSGEADPELFLYSREDGRLLCVSCVPGARPAGGASLPPGTGSDHLPRILADDGSRLAFDSRDALVPADTDGRQDVYLYEDGRPQLISTGRSGDMSALVEMSPTGRDVFFTTRERLAAGDSDNGADIYDARIGGGFAAVGEASPCAGEACRGPLGAGPALGPGPATEWIGPGHRSGRRRASCRLRRGGARTAERGARPRRCGRRR